MSMRVSNLPKTLAFDTSSHRGSVALLEGSQLHAELKLYRLQNHSKTLVRFIDFLMNGVGWTLQDLNLVAVGIGPGSFTGIRIGIATGLGIAQSLSIPFAGISGLEALAYQARFLNSNVGVLLNAQRGQVYFAEYRSADGKIRVVSKPSLMYLADLKRFIKSRHMYLIGDYELCINRMSKNSEKNWPRPVEIDLYLAAGIGRRAITAKRKWRSGEYIQCEPLYIRPPDAIKKRGRDH
jgi:tRNA threonylcarbamoyladenosine biosynthesis protein TsaB